MTTIRMVEDEMTISSVGVHPCFRRIIDIIREQFQSIDSADLIRQRSESFKKVLADSLKSVGEITWSKGSVFQNPALSDVPAIFKLDGHAECDRTCQSNHRINFVLCLNNRESIGTNFLKLEIAALDSIRNSRDNSLYDENILGILLTLDSSVLETGNWDSSYAAASEYTFAFKHAYKNLLKSNILALQFHYI